MRPGDDRNFAQALKLGRIIFELSEIAFVRPVIAPKTACSGHAEFFAFRQKNPNQLRQFEHTTRKSGRFNAAARRILSSSLHGIGRSFMNRIEAALEIVHWTETEGSCCSALRIPILVVRTFFIYGT